MRPTDGGAAGREWGHPDQAANRSTDDVAILAEHDAGRKQADALTRLGEMLKATPKNPGTRMLGGSVAEPPADVPTLADLGIDKKVSPTSGLSQSAGGKVAR